MSGKPVEDAFYQSSTAGLLSFTTTLQPDIAFPSDGKHKSLTTCDKLLQPFRDSLYLQAFLKSNQCALIYIHRFCSINYLMNNFTIALQK